MWERKGWPNRTSLLDMGEDREGDMAAAALTVLLEFSLFWSLKRPEVC